VYSTSNSKVFLLLLGFVTMYCGLAGPYKLR